MDKNTSIGLLNKGVADELQAMHQYMYWHEYAVQSSQNADAVSKQMFEVLVGDEERHFDEFDKQLDNIKRFGLSYLALQSFNAVPESPGPAKGQ